MKTLFLSILFFCCYFLNQFVFALPPLQLYIELTPAGGTLRPEPGIYGGPVVIKRPITIEGQGKVTLDAEGDGTVLTINADDVTIQGMHLTNSGESFDQVDAGILVAGDDNVIEHNRLDNVLFGIHISGGSGNRIKSNHISSKNYEPSLRGEGVRLWNSYDNIISENTIDRVRDVFITNSSNNIIQGNWISNSRIGIQLIFSPENHIIGNHISHNSTGLMLMYSNDLMVEDNYISHLRSFAGSAIAFKESNGVVVRNNQILHCAIGVSANAPVHPENILSLYSNRFAYNDISLYFYGEKGGHIVQENRFEKNLIDVQVSSATTALDNDWKHNFWDTYQGFDRNQDGIGDTPYELYSYSDRIWRDRPMTQFFRGSPVMEAIDFAERLTSFSEPKMILRDPEPKVH